MAFGAATLLAWYLLGGLERLGSLEKRLCGRWSGSGQHPDSEAPPGPEEGLDTQSVGCPSPTDSLATLPSTRQQVLAAFCLNSSA